MSYQSETDAAARRYPILRWFSSTHLPPELQAIAEPIAKIAWDAALNMNPSPEVSAGLRKLLEAKDCLVRGALEK
jgi:hypothetical protein